MEATTPVRVKFSELSSLHRGNYIVKPSEDPSCIYRRFTGFDDQQIEFFASGGFDSYGYHYRYDNKLRVFLSGKNSITGNIQRNSQRSSYTPIEILLDGEYDSYSVQGLISDNGTYMVVAQHSNLLLLSFYANSENSFIVEDNNSFSKDIYGIRFEIDHDRENSISSPEMLYTSLYETRAKFSDRDQKNHYLKIKLSGKENIFNVTKVDGAMKTFASIKPFFEAMDPNDILCRIAFVLACNGCKKTISSVKFSVAFNKIFSEVDTLEKFNEKVLEMSKTLEKETYFWRGDFTEYLQHLLDNLDDAREIKKAALKRKSTGAFNKIMDDLDFVTIDKEKYPLTHEAVFSGTLPTGTFFRKSGDSYFVYNDNWSLWEEMLAKFPEISKKIAEEASKRTTYEKDIMSYFYFVLHGLPEYLEKHTGKKWSGIPKLVQSANELEPPKEGSGGTAKSRSALTPIVDNEKNEVVVPYVSMRIGGYQTQYCYALDFNVIDRGFSFMGNVVTKSVEKELNGRDDYGLMFYTLTGSSTAQGYPTFLIIFERLLKGQTRVHFHRTHPMRSKGGDYNPIHNWTIGCYKWMIGNVNFERIKTQQGDLAFVEIEKFPEGKTTEVTTYDGHNFDHPVKYIPYTKKDRQNILGYVSIENDTFLNHREHMIRKIPAGIYEIRQCRSWEANPIGIWSLRID